MTPTPFERAFEQWASDLRWEHNGEFRSPTALETANWARQFGQREVLEGDEVSEVYTELHAEIKQAHETIFTLKHQLETARAEIELFKRARDKREKEHSEFVKSLPMDFALENAKLKSELAIIAGKHMKDLPEYLALRQLALALVSALEFLVEREPDDGERGKACTFCDMGGAGYSSKGDGHHDDVKHVCPVFRASEVLTENRDQIQKLKG